MVELYRYCHIIRGWEPHTSVLKWVHMLLQKIQSVPLGRNLLSVTRSDNPILLYLVCILRPLLSANIFFHMFPMRREGMQQDMATWRKSAEPGVCFQSASDFFVRSMRAFLVKNLWTFQRGAGAITFAFAGNQSNTIWGRTCQLVNKKKKEKLFLAVSVCP